MWVHILLRGGAKQRVEASGDVRSRQPPAHVDVLRHGHACVTELVRDRARRERRRSGTKRPDCTSAAGAVAGNSRGQAVAVGGPPHSAVLDSTKIRRYIRSYAPVLTFHRALQRMLAWRAEHPPDGPRRHPGPPGGGCHAEEAFAALRSDDEAPR